MMRIAVGLVTAFVIMTTLTEPKQVLFNLNCVLVSMSLGVSIAYLPVAWDALTRDKLTRADVLGLGIFLAWAGGGILRGLWALRQVGYDFSMSDLSAVAIALLICGAVCHMTAPQMLDERPRRQVWIAPGVWTAIGVMLMFLAVLPPLTWSG